MSIKEHRKFPRHSVSLKASCRIREKNQEEIEIRNFCRGGMFIVLSNLSRAVRLAVGEQVDIAVLVGVGGAAQELVFQARVARLEYGGCGVAFVNPDMGDLQILHDFVVAPVEPHQSFTSTADEVKRASLVSGCRQIIESRLEPMIDNFIRQIEPALLVSASEADKVEDQAIYFNGVESFKKSHDELAEMYCMAALNSVDGFPDEDSESEEEMPSAGGLSLLDDQLVDDWIAAQSMANRAEVENARELSALERRLTLLFGLPINRENNPYGPAVFAKAFQHAIVSMKLDSKINLVAYSLFRDVLAPNLTTVFQGLNHYLIKNNVMPKLTYGVAKPQISDSHAGHSEPTALSLPVDNEQPVAPVSDDQAPPPSTAENAQPEQDVYSLIQELNVLRDQLSVVSAAHNSTERGTTVLPTAQKESPVSEQNAPSYNARELLQALKSLQAGDAGIPKVPSAGMNVSQQLQTTLSQQNNGQIAKKIAPRDHYIIEASAQLYDTISHDAMVSEAVRPWIKQLELPMMKLALLDETVLTNQSHVAHELVNKIAQLEVFGAENEGGAVSEIVTRLINKINEEDNVSEQTFSEALKRIDALIGLQNKVLAANLSEVVQQSEAEPSPTTALALSKDDGIQRWQKKIQRLAKGSWVLFVVASQQSQRLQLAWVSKNFDRYVFVNIKGQRALTLTSEQLATQFDRGEAILLDSFDDSPVGRAQYTMLNTLHQDLLHESSHDQLTGLLNRQEFEKLLKRSLSSAIEEQQTYTLCYLDLDQFGLINANHGYHVGDKLLGKVANFLEKNLKLHAPLARVGGNSFAFVMENTEPDNAISFIEQQKITLQNSRFMLKKHRIPLSFSASLIPINDESGTASSVLQIAETGCRLAKESQQRVRVFAHGDDDVVREQNISQWATVIDDVLENDQLELRAQKIAPINSADGLVGHSEILLVVKNGEGQFSSPFDFIVAAERLHRIADVDRWVIAHTFSWVEENLDLAREMGGFAINMSGASVGDESFIDFIHEQLRLTSIPMDLICFEVTETAGIDNLSDATQFINELKKTGCRFALDDFGTGLSSYGHLKDLPVDYLKIDGVFVKDMLENPANAAVVKSITEIGHFMGKKVIAEFVEDDETIERLQEIGVDYAQGWGVEKPIMLRDLASQ